MVQVRGPQRRCEEVGTRRDDFKPLLERRKLIVLGDKAVGKTALLYVCSGNRFEYGKSEVTEIVSHVLVGDNLVEMTSLDVSEERTVEPTEILTYFDADVVLICFSVDNMTSFENVPCKWWPTAKSCYPGVPVLLVGNKKDLRNFDPIPWQPESVDDAHVTHPEGRAMADRICAYSYIECSAKSREGIQHVFEAAARAAVRRIGRKRLRKCVIQ